MLLDNFFKYKILEQKEGELSLEINLNPNHEIYKGHFPQIPILPGVCQVQILKESLNNVFGLNLSLVNAREIKFLSMLNPTENQIFTANINIDSSDSNKLKVSTLYFNEEVKYFKFKGEFLINE